MSDNTNIAMGSDNSFTGVMELVKMGAAVVPERYVLPPLQRPNCDLGPERPPLVLPVIDMSSLHDPNHRPRLVEEVGLACKELGCFQVINHGIHLPVIKNALHVATEFFDMPREEKMVYASDDVHQPVRYGISLNQVNDKVHCWRDFVKHYCNPISTWINLWPTNPPSYKTKMGDYAKATQMLHKQLMEVVFESLGLNPNYLHDEIDEGSHVMTVNCYPKCPQPDLVIGLVPHTDYGYLTIITQNNQGLEIMNNRKMWHLVQCNEGALIVQLGDQTEIISNGRYTSPVHQATVSSERKRISVASLHSLALERKVAPAAELVDEEHALRYKEGSFGDFLDFLSKNDITQERYIDTIKTEDLIEDDACL